MNVALVPYLPCPRCGMMPPDCLENPIPAKKWEKLLLRSEAERRRIQRETTRRILHDLWTAA